MMLTIAQPDLHSPSKHTIFASPLQAIGLPAPQWYTDMKAVAHYREVAKATLRHFLDVEVNTTNALHLYPRQKPRLTGILELAQGIVDLEVKLASITPPVENELDVVDAYHELNASQFAAMLPQISLHRLVKALAPPDHMVKSVVVSSPQYFSKLHSFLETTTKEVLTGFLVWKTVQQHADRIEDPALKSLKDFYAKLKGSRVDQPPERWRHCVNAMNADLSWLTSWFFLQGSKADLKKTKATEIADKVSSSFTKLIKKSTWMAKEDSERSANKVQALQQEISSPENMDASSLGKYYDTLAIKSYASFENKLAAARFETQQSWSKLVKATHAKDWHVTPLSTGPSYDPTRNLLILPETLLHSPMSYTKSIPDYVLYGSFGAMSGHGISKTLGPVGSYFSKNGSFADQWSEQTRKEYRKKTQCFVDQYSKYTVSGSDGKAHHVNGKLTLDVNMADVAGVNAAFEAWKEHEKHSPGLLVPGLEKYSRDQIFWIAFGNTLCSMTTENQDVQDVRSSLYTPERIRISVSHSYSCP
jgi:endothelin-converting enzyme